MRTDTSSDGALAGVRVLEIPSEFTLYGGKLLAELGADVVLVEPPDGSPLRRLGPFYHDWEAPETSLFFLHYNTSKRGIAVDLSGAEGQNQLRRLAAEVDIVLDGLPPGTLNRLDLGYGRLSAGNRGLIVTSVTPFGQNGPYAAYQASDLVACAASGLLYLTGFPDRPPVRPGGNQSFHVAGVTAAYSTLIAFYHRLITGEGQHVDVSVQQCLALCQEDAMQWWDLARQVRRRRGLPLRGPVSGHVACKDGYVYINLRDGWPDLVAWMASEGLAGALADPQWHDPAVRAVHEEEVNRLATPFFMAHTRAELTEEAQRRRILIMPVHDIAEVCHDPQLAARRFFQHVKHPDLDDTLDYPGAPYQIPQAPWRLRGPAPHIGQHNAELLSKVRRPGPETRGSALSLPHAAPPLRGIRVLDFSWWIAGPAATKVLAAHGAEVVKIESRARIDPVRPLEPVPPDKPGVNSGGYFNNLNTDKLSVTLDLGSPQARELVRRLVALSDVVFENFAGPWVMERWGLGYDSLARINPHLIMVSMPAIGPDGPLSRYRALGNHLQAALGLNAMTGFADRPPVGIGAVAFPDHGCNPLHALTALLAALAHRTRTGRGGHVTVPQYESTACFIGPALLNYTANGRVTPRAGNTHPQAAPHGVFRCRPEDDDADRWLAVGVLTEEQWGALCAVIGRPALAADPRFVSLAARLAHREELDREIEAWTVGQFARPAMERLQAAGVPAARVANARDLLEDDPQLRARGHYVALGHPEVGRIYHDGPPFRLSRTPGRLRRSAPLLGAHTIQVLQGLLGLSDEEVSALVIGKAVD